MIGKLAMEVPKFLKCPECDEKYGENKKRRVIDSCGHPRCFSCLVLDNQCSVCQTILGRRQSWVSSRDSLLSTDGSQDGNKSNHGSTQELFSKEKYLRTLYRYDPESTDYINIRRGSLDLQTRKLQDMKLGRHSNSALALPNEVQNLSPKSRKINDPRRSSLQDLIFARKLSANVHTLNSTLPSAPKKYEAKHGNKREESFDSEDSSDISQAISPRSSGYWSEVEYYSDPEVNSKNNLKNRTI